MHDTLRREDFEFWYEYCMAVIKELNRPTAEYYYIVDDQLEKVIDEFFK